MAFPVCHGHALTIKINHLRMRIILFLLPFCFLMSCGDKTGPCTTTCFSKSSGQNLGAVTYDNYTKSECEAQLAARQTNLTDCTMEWN